ncbi:cytokinin dehydrogenase 3-like protein [Tanacetum coccineum]
MIDEPVVKEKQSSLVKGLSLLPPLPTQGSTPAGNTPSMSSYATPRVDAAMKAISPLVVEETVVMECHVVITPGVGLNPPPSTQEANASAGNALSKPSYATDTGKPSGKKVNVRTLYTPGGNGIDVVKYGLVRSMFNSSTRLFSFQFSSIDGLDAMLENVKLHGVLVTAFSEDGLSAIATKLGTPLMLDSYTSNMCMQSWGRSSYARVMIELRADVELKDNIVVAMPKITKEGHYTCVGEKNTVKKPSQTSQGVPVGPKIGFKPQKEYRPVAKNPNASSSGNKKKGVEPIIEVSNSNPFEVLNSVNNDVEFGTNGGLLIWSGGGKEVKEKNKVVTIKDVVSSSMIDEPVVKEKQSSLVKGLSLFPPLPTQGSTPASNTPSKGIPEPTTFSQEGMLSASNAPSSLLSVGSISWARLVNDLLNTSNVFLGEESGHTLLSATLLEFLGSIDGLDAMLENGPWFIQNNPLILQKWHPYKNLLKEDVSTPLMLDSYTSDMCMQSWGRSSYARVMIELRADVELKDNIVVAMPKITMEGHYTCAGEKKTVKKPSQTSRGVPVVVKIERGFLSQKRSRGGRELKEKNKVVATKDVVSSSMIDEPVVKEKQSSLVEGLSLFPPLPTQGSTPAGNTPSMSSYATPRVDASMKAKSPLVFEETVVMECPVVITPGVGPNPTTSTQEANASAGNAPSNPSYATATGKPSGKKVNVYTLYTPGGNGIDVVVLVNYRLVSSMFKPRLPDYSPFISSLTGLDAMLENGPWLNSIGVLVTAFSEDGLSAIATKLGTPLMLDSYTSDMCMQSWGRSSYARVMIELRADVELKDNIFVAMPKITKEGHYTCAGEKKTVKKPSQTSRGVPVGPKIGFKPQKEYRPVAKNPNASSSGNKKKGVEPTIEVSNSNPFEVLKSVNNDVEFGTNMGLLIWSGGGREVKEKNKVVATKDVVSPSVIDEPVVKEKQSSLVEGLSLFPPLPTQGSTPAGNTPSMSSYATPRVDAAMKAISPLVVEETVVMECPVVITPGVGPNPPPSTQEANASAGNAPSKPSYATATGKPSGKKVNVRTLYTPGGNGIDVVVLVDSIRAISERFANTSYGFFLGKKVAYPVVANYVKLHGVLVTAFSEDGLSAIATKLGTPLMLDSYSSDMCMQSWGRSSYARVMIELRANLELKDNIIVAMPKITKEGHYTCTGEKKTVKKPSQTSRGVPVGPKIGFKPQKEYRPVAKNPNASSSGNNKKGVEPTIEGTTNLVNNEATSSGSSFMNIDNDGEFACNTPIGEKIDKIEPQNYEGQLRLLDNDGNPLVPTGIVESDSEVEVVFDETANLRIPTSGKDGSDKGYGTNSLLEQWRDSYPDNDDYDPYDDDMYQNHDLSEHL